MESNFEKGKDRLQELLLKSIYGTLTREEQEELDKLEPLYAANDMDDDDEIHLVEYLPKNYQGRGHDYLLGELDDLES